MRVYVFLLFAMPALWAVTASADPVAFQPDACEFSVSFPAPPAASQIQTQTSRGDSVTLFRASLNDGGNYLRAECTHVAAMHFIDEGILQNNMEEMGAAYKLETAVASVEHNGDVGPIGKLHGRGKVGGKEMTVEVRRYTGKSSIFDVWIATDPGDFPSAADTAFLQSVRFNDQPLK